jgi:hypothetical protein
MKANAKQILLGVGIGVLAYVLVNRKSKTIIEVKSKAEGDDLVSTDDFSYIDGEVYNADGDFYGVDGNFYDADGTFLGADGTYESADGDFYSADGDFYSAEGDYENAVGKRKRPKRKKVKVRKPIKASKKRSLALNKQKLNRLNLSKKRLASKKTSPRVVANLDKKIRFANRSIAKYTGYLD